MKQQEIIIREATVTDAETLSEIYAYYVEHTAITFETQAPSVAEFTERICVIQEWYPYFVAECQGEILGYAYAHRYHERAAFGWDVETTIYVRQDKKRAGLGKLLYEALETALKKQGVVNCYALVAEPEQEDEYLTRDSIHFHEKMGYTIAGTLHFSGCKFGRWYHLTTLEKFLGDHGTKMEAIKPYKAVR